MKPPILKDVISRIRRKTLSELNKMHNSTHSNILRTESISYPRSGHGALYSSLSHYFGADLHYCAAEEYNNCGCSITPCSNPLTNFSKNHDFYLYKNEGIDIRLEQQYIIQYRNPIRSITSYYYLFLAANPTKSSKKEWYPFAHSAMLYWNRFIDKWVINAESDEKMQLICPYEQFIQNPKETLEEIITFMTKEEAHEKQLRRTLGIMDLKPRNRIADFKYFDKGFFQKIEAMAGSRLEQLSIPSFMDGV